MIYPFVYKRKSDGRKVLSKTPLNYSDLELVSCVKNISMIDDSNIVLKKSRKKKKYDK